MISFLFCLAVLPTRYLFGLTLRPSAPVCCCDRVSWARGRLAFAQEAVRCPPPLSPRLVLHVLTRARWSQAACEKFLFKRCLVLKVLQLRKVVIGFSHIPSVCTVLDRFFGVRLSALEIGYVLVH